MMVERNAEGRAVVVFANEALARMLGYKQEEMIGMLGRELFLPGDRVLLHERNRRRRKGEKLPSHSGVMALRKDGSLLPIELSMGAMNLKGKPATVVYIRDVTDRKAAEEALRQSETQFRAIFENAAMGVGIVDSQGRPLKINPAFEKMIGYTLEELRQTPFKKFMHPDDAFSDARLFAEMAEGKRDKYVMEKRYIRKDGQTFWGRLTLSAVRDADGRLSFAVGMIEDITGVKKAEEERLRHIKRIEALYAIAQAASQTLELEELLNLALDKTLEVMAADLGGIYLMDVLEKELALRASKGLPEDVVEQVSSIKLGTRKIQEIQKWAEGSLTLEDVFGGNVIRQVSKAIGEAQIKSYAVVPFFIRGQLYGLLAVGNRTRREFSTADIDLLKGIANQIGIGTHNAVLYEEVRALIRETLDAQERERERVCLDVHDGVAQTLVAAFQYLQSLEAIAPNEKDIKGLIAKATVQVKKAIQESREIINSLQPATLREVGLVATLRHEMKRLEQETGLKVEFKADDIRLPRDIETGLYRIIHEAVFNARKHSKTRRLRVRINSVNGLVKVEVKDWGKGFAQAHLDSSKRRGTGLFSIRKRTELMKGTCDIKSAPGQGTTVYVEVPFAPAKE
jgi:PAS domain S-box-containing protein